MKIKRYVDVPKRLGDITREPNGFPNRTDSSIVFSDSSPDRTFTISPVGIYFEFYSLGRKFRKTVAESIQIDDTDGLWFIYYEADGILTVSQTPWEYGVGQIFVAIGYWDTISSSWIGHGEERHGLTMDTDTHRHFHETFGTIWQYGYSSSVLVDENGSFDIHAEIQSVSAGEIHDEDIQLTYPPQTEYSIWYKTGTGIWKKTIKSPAAVAVTATRPDYNEFTGSVWQRTEVANTKFTLTHAFATDAINGSDSLILIMGENQYNSKGDAREGAKVELAGITTADLPTAEFVPIATYIIECRDSYTNSYNARLVSTEDGFDYIDWRESEKVGSGVPTSHHGNLTGLGEDDHLQYLLADGARELTGDWGLGGTYGITEVPYIDFNLGYLNGAQEGRMQWNSEDGTLEYGLPGGNVVLQIGQEQLIKVSNKSGEDIGNGKAVYISGAQGSRPTVALAKSDIAASSLSLGVATEPIANNGDGYVNIQGLVRDIDTSAIIAGNVAFLSESTAGAFRATPPAAPNFTAVIGICIFQNSESGILLINTLTAPKMVSLSDVDHTPANDTEFLRWNDTNGRFELENDSSIDHGNLAGRGEDDHLQYLPLNGARAMTGELAVPSNTKVTLNGFGGDTYIIYNSTSDQVEIWKGGIIQVSW